MRPALCYVIIAAAVPTHMLLAGAPVAFYTDATTFDQTVAAAGLSPAGIEDFEEARLPPIPPPPDNRATLSDPLTPLTSNGLFLPGDILPGLAFQANTNNTAGENDPGLNGAFLRGVDGLLVGGPGYFSLPDSVLLANFLQDGFDVLVSNPAYAAFRLKILDFGLFGSNGVVNVHVFDAGGALLASTSVSARAGQDSGFLGIVASAGVTVARIHLHDGASSGGVGAEGLHEITVYASSSPCEPDGDVNQDGHLDGEDLAPFTAALLAASTDAADLCTADFSGNGAIDPADTPPLIAALLEP